MRLLSNPKPARFTAEWPLAGVAKITERPTLSGGGIYRKECATPFRSRIGIRDTKCAKRGQPGDAIRCDASGTFGRVAEIAE